MSALTGKRLLEIITPHYRNLLKFNYIDINHRYKCPTYKFIQHWLMLCRGPRPKLPEYPSPFSIHYNEYSKKDVQFELLEEKNRM